MEYIEIIKSMLLVGLTFGFLGIGFFSVYSGSCKEEDCWIRLMHGWICVELCGVQFVWKSTRILGARRAWTWHNRISGRWCRDYTCGDRVHMDEILR